MSRQSSWNVRGLLVGAAIALAGCDGGSSPAADAGPQGSQRAASTPVPGDGAPGASAPALPAGLFLGAAPAGARPVEEVKASAKVGDEVVIAGRIGGSASPFVDGRAIFTLMGPGLRACSENPGDSCATPWDYCCERAEDIALHAATIRVVGADGQTLRAGLKGEAGLRELGEVVAVGRVAQAEGGVLVVDAVGVYVGGK